MSKIKFFSPDGKKEINMKEFVDLYSEDYFLPGKGLVPGLRRSSGNIEKVITDILKDGIKTERDVARILAWKIGKIKHGESENESKKVGETVFKYSSDWEHADELKDVHLYDKDKEFPIKKIASYIIKNKDYLNNPHKSAQDFLNETNAYFLRNSIPRIGTVYMITLLYFLSHGEHPIYDRFAMMALNAILDGKRPGEVVEYTALPDKNSKKRFSKVMDCEMKIYERNFETVFNPEEVYKEFGITKEDMKTDRRFDQALWTYGHLFTDGKKTTCC